MFERPTISELVTRIESDFITRLELEGALLRRAVVRILSRVLAGAAHMLHGHLEFLGRQMFPDLSEEEFLVRQAAVFGLSKTVAAFSGGLVTFTGTNGTEITSGTVLLRADGVEFTVRDTTTISGSSEDIYCTASVAGTDGDCDTGTILTFESPITNVDAEATVLAGITGGADAGTIEELRAALLARLQEPPHGGNEADGIAWAKSVAGVTRAWIYPLELGPGTVVLRFARDNDVSPIPSSGEVDEVQAVLDEEAPVHAAWTAVAPTASADAFSIHPVPDTSDTRAAIQAELVDLYLREGAPGGTIKLSAIRTAIGTAAGVTDYTCTAVADVTHTLNQLPTVGTITWV